MRSIGVAAAVAALALGVAGCGGSSDSGSDAAADTTATTTSSTTDTTASTEDASTDSAATDTTSTTGGELAGLSGKCKDLAEAGQKFSAAVTSSTGAGGSDPEATAAAFKEFVKQAPDELKDDFGVLANVIAVYAKALKEINFKPGTTPTAAQIAKLAKVGQSLNSADVQKASAAIAAWGQKNCGSTP